MPSNIIKIIIGSKYAKYGVRTFKFASFDHLINVSKKFHLK